MLHMIAHMSPIVEILRLLLGCSIFGIGLWLALHSERGGLAFAFLICGVAILGLL